MKYISMKNRQYFLLKKLKKYLVKLKTNKDKKYFSGMSSTQCSEHTLGKEGAKSTVEPFIV
jgi:hypothetical protein